MSKKWLCLFVMLITVFHCSGVCMAQEAKEQTLLEIQEQTQVYEKEDKSSAVVTTLEKGTAVIGTETVPGEWYQITYQDIRGYVSASDLELYGDSEKIDEEFEEIEEADVSQVEGIYEVQQQKKSQYLWGGIMAVIIVLMFATGIYAVQKNKGKGAADKR